MHHFGAICPNTPGHHKPMIALADALRSKGHRVTFFLVGDPPSSIAAAGFETVVLGRTIFPAEGYRDYLARLGTLEGRPGVRHTIAGALRTAEATLTDGPEAMRGAGISSLIVDQISGSAGSVAESLGIPFVTVCNALMLHSEADVPPCFLDWPPGRNWLDRARHRVVHAGFERAMRPIVARINRFRMAHGLAPSATLAETWSPIAQISQVPAAFEFPRRELPPVMHFVGPLRLPGGDPPIPFPYERLDGRPIIYVSLGTLQNRIVGQFRLVAEACAGFDAQVVITMGGGLSPQVLGHLPGRPLVVPYAPQVELLRRSALVISHAGLNTVLEAMSESVPIVAIPVTNDQPGVAARVAWSSVGELLRWDRLDPRRLRVMIERVWMDPRFREGAGRMQRAIRESGGAPRAARVVEEAIAAA